MRIMNVLKLTSLVALVFTVAIGCSSTSDSEGTSPEQAAIDAIAAAKKANKQAKSIGYEWRDTAKVIKKAEKSLDKQDYNKAIKLANKARRQAENAIAQQRAESNRLAAEFGTAATAMPLATSGQYSVVRGDNLWDISAKPDVYNNPYQWPLIYKANSDKITDADLIYPGQSLDVDTSPSSAQVNAAVTHAKSRGAWSIGAVEASDKAYLAN